MEITIDVVEGGGGRCEYLFDEEPLKEPSNPQSDGIQSKQKPQRSRSTFPMIILIAVFIVAVVGLSLAESRKSAQLDTEVLATMTLPSVATITTPTSVTMTEGVTTPPPRASTETLIHSVDLSRTTIMLGEKKMGFPCAVDDFIELIPDPLVLLAQGGSEAYLSPDGSVEIKVVNFSSTEEAVKDCDITEISIIGSKGKELYDLSINDISVGSGEADLLEAFGVASGTWQSDNQMQYRYIDTKHLVEVVFTLQNNIVEAIQYGAY